MKPLEEYRKRVEQLRLQNDYWGLSSVETQYQEDVTALCDEVERVTKAYVETCHEVEQILAQALGGYPWYKDDQQNFPGATQADGVCVGEHVPESLALSAANEIKRLRALSIANGFGHAIDSQPNMVYINLKENMDANTG